MSAALLILTAARLWQPPIRCAVTPQGIVVRFIEPPEPNMTQFAIVTGRDMAKGEWLDVVGPFNRLSSYRPGLRRLMIDPRRQFAARDIDGKQQLVRPFVKRGYYTLVFADSIEIDLQDIISMTCTIRIK